MNMNPEFICFTYVFDRDIWQVYFSGREEDEPIECHTRRDAIRAAATMMLLEIGNYPPSGADMYLACMIIQKIFPIPDSVSELEEAFNLSPATKEV
jgi:hypothetical protein